ncbi:MAG: substrate-binding domain-containing protein [Treponemataceae bacterium]
MRVRNGWIVPALIVFLLVLFQSCEEKGQITVGLSFAEFATERWAQEHALLSAAAKERGMQVISRVANHDPVLQSRQIESLTAQKVDVLIIVPEDGAMCAPAVAAAKRVGVKVIAYDRFIRSPAVDVFITFDSVEIGRVQAAGVLKKRASGDFMLLGGSPTDFNARLLRKGQMEILQPFVDSGKIRIVASEWVVDWLPSLALISIERVLKERNGKIDAVVASNDGTALAVVGALKNWGLAGDVPVSGQDAGQGGCKAVIDGTLSVTVLKDFRKIAPIAIDYAVKLVKGEPLGELHSEKLSELTLDETIVGSVNCRFLPIVPIDQSNVYEEIIRSGFQSYDAVYAEVPPEMRPARP